MTEGFYILKKLLDPLAHVGTTKAKESGWFFRPHEDTLEVVMRCPGCLEIKDLKNHEILPDGKVLPEIYCVCDKFHEDNVELERWPIGTYKNAGVKGCVITMEAKQNYAKNKEEN